MLLYPGLQRTDVTLSRPTNNRYYSIQVYPQRILLYTLYSWCILVRTRNCLKGQCHQIRMALKWGSFKGLSWEIRRLIFKIFWRVPLIYYRHFNFLSWGSKSVQIFHFVLNLIWGCSKWVQICSICVLNIAGAAQFRSWTEVEETIILNLCSEPI